MARPDILGGFERVLNPYILGDKTLRDVFEIRLIHEMGMAEFLFARKTDKQINELEIIVETQKSIERPTKEEEIKFHTKLYSMTGNDTFIRFQKMLFPVFDHVFTEYRNGEAIISPPDHIHHDGLVKVLKTGTAADFRKAMEIHLGPYFNIINV